LANSVRYWGECNSPVRYFIFYRWGVLNTPLYNMPFATVHIGRMQFAPTIFYFLPLRRIEYALARYHGVQFARPARSVHPRINGLKFLVPISMPAARQTVLSPNLKLILSMAWYSLTLSSLSSNRFIW